MIENYKKEFYIKQPIDWLVFYDLTNYKLLIGGDDFLINNHPELKFTLSINNKTNIKKTYMDFIRNVYLKKDSNITFIRDLEDINPKFIFIDEVRKRIFVE